MKTGPCGSAWRPSFDAKPGRQKPFFRERCHRTQKLFTALIKMLLSILLPASLSSPAVLGEFHYQRLKSFGFPNESGEFPNGLIQGSDGALYGTTRAGGTNNAGIAFKLNKDGNGYAALHYFRGGDDDGSQPAAELIEGSDGALYGTTAGGGTNNGGTLFRMNKNGSG